VAQRQLDGPGATERGAGGIDRGAVADTRRGDDQRGVRPVEGPHQPQRRAGCERERKGAVQQRRRGGLAELNGGPH